MTQPQWLAPPDDVSPGAAGPAVAVLLTESAEVGTSQIQVSLAMIETGGAATLAPRPPADRP